MSIVQEVYTSDITRRSLGAGTFPQDNTKPQDTEGFAYTQLDTTITPQSASNILQIDVYVSCDSSSNNRWVPLLCLFETVNGADALQTAWTTATDLGGLGQTWLRHRMIAGSTSALTFKVRMGISLGTLWVNGSSSANFFGDTLTSWMHIKEISPGGGGGGGAGGGMSARVDPEKINLRISNQGLSVNNKNTGVSQTIDNAKWKLVVKAWA